MHICRVQRPVRDSALDILQTELIRIAGFIAHLVCGCAQLNYRSARYQLDSQTVKIRAF
jgi:hypothetical protein